MSEIALVFVLAQAAAPNPRPAPLRPDLSWADADSLSRKIEALEKRPREAKPERIPISQAELNSYLNLALKMPPGLSDLDVRMEQDRLSVKGLVDLDQLKGKMPPAGAFNPLSYLGGRVPVELKGRLPNDDGFGTLEFEDLRLGGLPIPPSFLAQVVAAATRTPESPRGFDIQAPFRLPYSVKRVRVQPGKAFLEL